MSDARESVGLPAGFQLGRYRLEKIYAAWGFYLTYLARDTDGRAVAVHELLPEELVTRAANGEVIAKSESAQQNMAWAREEFLREGRALMACAHPALQKIIEVFEANGTAYWVTSRDEPRTFKDWLRDLGHAPKEPELRPLLEPLLAALEEIHAASRYHLNLKPDSIQITPTGKPVLAHLGGARQAIARHCHEAAAVTTGYSAPEQYDMEETEGAATDIYGMAAVLYRAITGRAPPDAEQRLGSDLYEPLAGRFAGQYRHNFLVAIDAALALDAAERPASVRDWRKKLGIAADNKLSGYLRRYGTFSLIGFSAVVAIAMAWSFIFRPRPSPTPSPTPTPTTTVTPIPPIATPTPALTPTATSTPTPATPVPTPTPIVTPQPSPTSTPIVSATPQPSPTSTPIASATPQPSPTSTPIASATPQPSPTSTPIASATPVPTSTPAPSHTGSSTPAPTPTSSPTSSATISPSPNPALTSPSVSRSPTPESSNSPKDQHTGAKSELEKQAKEKANRAAEEAKKAEAAKRAAETAAKAKADKAVAEKSAKVADALAAVQKTTSEEAVAAKTLAEKAAAEKQAAEAATRLAQEAKVDAKNKNAEKAAAKAQTAEKAALRETADAKEVAAEKSVATASAKERLAQAAAELKTLQAQLAAANAEEAKKEAAGKETRSANIRDAAAKAEAEEARQKADDAQRDAESAAAEKDKAEKWVAEAAAETKAKKQAAAKIVAERVAAEKAERAEKAAQEMAAQKAAAEKAAAEKAAAEKAAAEKPGNDPNAGKYKQSQTTPSPSEQQSPIATNQQGSTGTGLAGIWETTSTDAQGKPNRRLIIYDNGRYQISDNQGWRDSGIILAKTGRIQMLSDASKVVVRSSFKLRTLSKIVTAGALGDEEWQRVQASPGNDPNPPKK